MSDDNRIGKDAKRAAADVGAIPAPARATLPAELREVCEVWPWLEPRERAVFETLWHGLRPIVEERRRARESRDPRWRIIPD